MLQILSSLWHEQGITQQVLAERTAKDKACLTNLMNNLEKKGYVCRKEDPADRRSKLVYLTKEGEEFRNQIRPILDQVYVNAEQIIGLDSIRTMMSELKSVYDVLGKNKYLLVVFLLSGSYCKSIASPADSLFTVDELFPSGVTSGPGQSTGINGTRAGKDSTYFTVTRLTDRA